MIGTRTFLSGKAWLKSVLVVLAVLFLLCRSGLAQTSEEHDPATFSLELASFTSDFSLVEFNPPPPNIEEIQKAWNLKAGNAPVREAISLKSVAPNPEGPNLASLAIPSASSYWPWPAPNWETPDKAIDGDLRSFWASSFSDRNAWFRLDWPQPMHIDRIYLTDGSNIRGHTVHYISFYNLASAS
jgi:hypothetical protein